MKVSKDKYYTPSIEEFFVGFEYEVFQKGVVYDPNVMYLMAPDTEDKWVKFTYPDPFLGYNLDRMFKTYTIRTKYLDKDDIESLGFKHSGSKMIKGYRDSFKYHPDTHIHYGMEYTYSLNKVRITKEDSNYFHEYEIVLFDGEVKSKSELKKLLKQLKIVD